MSLFIKRNINLYNIKKINFEKPFQLMLINKIMKKGLKFKAIKLLLNVLANLKKEYLKEYTNEHQSPLKYLHKLLTQFSPIASLKNIKFGSTTYLVPTPLSLIKKFKYVFI